MYGDQSREFEASRVNFYVDKSNSSWVYLAIQIPDKWLSFNLLSFNCKLSWHIMTCETIIHLSFFSEETPAWSSLTSFSRISNSRFPSSSNQEATDLETRKTKRCWGWSTPYTLRVFIIEFLPVIPVFYTTE